MGKNDAEISFPEWRKVDASASINRDAPPPASAAPAPKFNFRDLSVLIVDEDPFAQVLTRETCWAVRFGDILTADDPVQAVNLLKSKKVDIVICEGKFASIAGDRLVRGIRAGAPDPYIPIIMLTALSDPATVTAARDAGASDVLTRPIVLDNFLSRLAVTLTMPRPFVRSDAFFGPDRRRQARSYDGPDRRVQAAVGEVKPPRTHLELFKRVTRAGGMSLDEMATAGKTILAGQQDRYRRLCDEDLAELFSMIRNFKEDPAAGYPLIQPIRTRTRKIENLGLTFGYPILSEASHLLCQLLDYATEARVGSPTIIQGIETHATVMSLIVKQDIRDDASDLRDELIDGLTILVDRAAKLA